MFLIFRGIIIEPTIFVSVASYIDPLLFFTINELITKAKYPGNLRIAVVDQNYHDQRTAINKLPYAKQIRYMHLNLADTLGVSWARNLAFSLYDNETYFLQIDAHTLFDQDWDVELIDQHTQLLKRSKKPIVSSYPNSFNIVNGEPEYQINKSRTSAIVTRPCEGEKLKKNTPILMVRGEIILTTDFKLACHIAGGFYFCHGTFIEEVPYDPYLYFSGEEQSLSIRAYTKGWDIYHPTYIPLYHKYKVANVSYESQHWYGDFSAKRSIPYERLLERSRQRLVRLFYGDGMVGTVYGLGSTRTLKDYASMCGVDYQNKTITGTFVGDHLGA